MHVKASTEIKFIYEKNPNLLGQSLKTIYMGDKEVTRVSLQILRAEFENMPINNMESSIEDYFGKITSITNQIKQIGEDIEDS